MGREEYGKSGRKRHYRDTKKPSASASTIKNVMSNVSAGNGTIRSKLSNYKSPEQIERDNRFTAHAYEARKANAARALETENWQRDKAIKKAAAEAAYKKSLKGRAIGGLTNAYHTGQKVADTVGNVGRGAWEMAKKFGRGALAFGKGLYNTGKAAKKGVELAVQGGQIAHRSIPDVKNLAATTGALLTGKMKREDFDNQARDSLTNLGHTWEKPVNYIDEKLDNFADKYIEGSRLQDYAGRAAEGLGNVMSLPGRALGGITNWMKGGKK
jgi:hypothetical protein